MKTYLGIDVGSVTTKFAVLDENDDLVTNIYLPTQGKPIEMVQQGLKQIKQQLSNGADICGSYYRKRPLPGWGYRRCRFS